MKIFAVVENDFAETVWGKAILDGMKHRASELKHEICEIKDLDVDFEGQKKVVVLVGTANSWINKTLCSLWEHSIRGIVLNCQPTEIVSETSYILIDYACATYECIQYLHSCERRKIALFAINPNSITDTTKHKSFIEYGLSEKDVYISDDSLTGCYARLKEKISEYNAVICANDIAAVSLIRRLENDGIRVPEDIYVVGFGNLLIGRYFSHTITSMTLNDVELGRQAVSMYAYLVKSEVDINVQMTIPCELILGDTTEHRSVKKQKRTLKSHAAEENYFYGDTDVREIMTIENFLTRCDDTDMKIISGIINELPYAEIGEKAYISGNAVKYRVKRMLSETKTENKSDFKKLIRTYCEKIAEK